MPRRCLTLALLLVIASIAAAQGYLPDHGCTPGAVNPDVTQVNIARTVCVSGWTTRIRPPVAYTNHLKVKQMRLVGLPGTPHDYHEDHLVSSCAGGHPTDPRNL